MRILLHCLFLIFLSAQGFTAPSQNITQESAINLMTYLPEGFRVDNTDQGSRVRRLLIKIKALGINTIIFNFRATMVGGTTNTVTSVVPLNQQAEEERLLKGTILYARTIGLNSAFRPILLVVGPHGEFPYEENGYTWWHGVIRPADPIEWFQSFYDYHARYMKIATETQINWYSIGAEMHSLTSGLGSRSQVARRGRPDLWLDFIAKARALMGPQIKLTYGVNFTDQYVLEDGIRTWGGEFEQWRHDMTFSAKTADDIHHQENLRNLWKALDFVGLDYYRALGSSHTDYPKPYNDLVNILLPFSQQHATYLKDAMDQMNLISSTKNNLAVQEVGYRSVEKCFVSPYLYEDDEAPINYLHQAAAWDALLQSLWTPQTSWIQSVGIWQVLVDDDSDLVTNGGFSPLGKEPTQAVLKRFFLNDQSD